MMSRMELQNSYESPDEPKETATQNVSTSVSPTQKASSESLDYTPKIDEPESGEQVDTSSSSQSNGVDTTGPKPASEDPKRTAKILYRYIQKSEEGEVWNKQESYEPIVLKVDDSAIGLTEETVLEIITTKIDKTPIPRVFMKIHSRLLTNALKDVIRYYPGLSWSRSLQEFNAPYAPLFLYMKELERYKTNHPPGHQKAYITATNADIDVLLGFLENTCNEAMIAEIERHQKDPAVATFEYLWLLFRPGEQVLVRDSSSGFLSPYVLVRWLHEWGSSDYAVLWNIASSVDGHLDPFPMEISIAPYEGEMEIASLPIFPKRFHPKLADFEQEHIERGRKYLSYCVPSYVEYSGPTIGPPSLEINGKVMVDNSSWERENKNKDQFRSRLQFDEHVFMGPQLGNWEDPFEEGCECNACDFDIDKPKSELLVRDLFLLTNSNKSSSTLISNQNLPNDFYFLCSHVIGGYALRERVWVKFHIDRIRDLEIEPDPFANLVLDSEIKDTIEALVWNYAQTDSRVRSWSKDFVRDKGEGRIFLLHGSPGVGKTCTAECVADLIRRPLLALTCGDMGITASRVEASFKSYFELAELWGAVVLMDEADVYLEQRTSENLERNSLVSVFLRALEYFRGVLFLTTNRIGAFDDAFISRIHVALHYKRLNDEYRSKIWEKNIQRLIKGGNIEVSPSAIIYAVSDPDVKAVEWNGREIRNAFQTAVALAQYDARKANATQVILKVEHLSRVVKMSKLFKEYVTSTHKNQDEARRAMIEERRNDSFDVK